MEISELNKVIYNNLKKYGIGSFEEVNSATRSQYAKIEEYCQRCIAEYRRLRDEVEAIDISVKGVCTGSGIGRSTVYASNNTHLRMYIENRIKEIGEDTDIFNKKKLDNLREQFAEAEKKFDSLKINTINQMQLELENRSLKIDKETLELEKQRDNQERALFLERITFLERKIADLQARNSSVVSMNLKKNKK